MNRLGILAHQARELWGCTEDTVALEDAAAAIAYCEKVESGELPLIADEIAIYEARIVSLLNLTHIK
jgi:hypothetical protein